MTAAGLSHRIGCMQFTHEMQLQFAELSGDFNPLHVDKVASRRFLYGEPVVHGVHVVLQAMEAFVRTIQPAKTSIESLRAQFRGPAMLETPVEYVIKGKDKTSVRIVATCMDVPVLDLSLQWSESVTATCRDFVCHQSPPRERPDRVDQESLPAVSGSVELTFDRELARRLLPHTAAWMPPYQVALLLASTRIVGMKCPGYHSIFSDLDLDFAPEPNAAANLEYRVTHWDPRFRLAALSIAADGGSGKIKAFLRPEPKSQPTLSNIAENVGQSEFADQRALVIGGSRGLGEFVAKLLAAGGADVRLTYHRGSEDATRVADEILRAGHPVAFLQYDASAPDANLCGTLEAWQPTHLYYFATPQIYKSGKKQFSAAHFSQLCDVYLEGFARIVDNFSHTSQLTYVFYPSTEFLDTLPKGMAEYVAAKAAGEALCRYLARRHPEIRFVAPRLPRVATDQTAELLSGADVPTVSMLRDALQI